MRILHRLTGFGREEDGALISFGLFLLVVMFAIGGIAVDVLNAYRAKTHLQVAADSAAHAALMSREFFTASEAKAKAIAIADGALPYSSFGETLTTDDIKFGYWDRDAEVFVADASSNKAVMVETGRVSNRLNPEATFFLKFVGINSWDIKSQSVFETYYPTCLREGFVAEAPVAVTSGNTYKSGFCIHSNTLVTLSTANKFEPNTIVSMPDKRDIDVPSGDLTTNPGLAAALRDGSYKLRILDRIAKIISGLQDTSSVYYRDYINGVSSTTLSRTDKLDSTSFVSGKINFLNCSIDGQSAKIHAASVLSKVVLITNCSVMFGENVVLEDTVIATTSTAAKSISAASGLQIGKDDNCAEGGGAQIVTMGGADIPQYLKMFGGQIIAAGDVAFTSDANGIQGASIISGGRIDGTTDSTMAFCGKRMEDNFQAAYFRLAG